jgi:GNAT superfamily N-acetyltransferase
MSLPAEYRARLCNLGWQAAMDFDHVLLACDGFHVWFRNTQRGDEALVCVRITGAPDDETRRAMVTIFARPADGEAFRKAIALSVSWQSPNNFDTGFAMLGDGRIDVAPGFRGRHIGSLAMHVAIMWLHSLPPVPVNPITLSADDAGPENRARRNRFYERLGFSFIWDVQGASGESRPISTHELQLFPDNRWTSQGKPGSE